MAFLRTGVALITIAVALYRLFPAAYFIPAEILLTVAGVFSIYDGLRWYVPVRAVMAERLEYEPPPRREGVTVLQTAGADEREPRFIRSHPAIGADELRARWESLRPVERRRFLANDRTDLAEERTYLASLRTTMAKGRLGLAFTRSGIAFAGLGIALVRKLPAANWNWFDYLLIVIGALMALEGLYWQVPGYRAGLSGLERFRRSLREASTWDEFFPPLSTSRGKYPRLKASQAPGIWGTTGLALERTVLAERRNLMSRLRTVMAFSRTGMAFIRTGMSISAVGAGLIAFLAVSAAWGAFEIALIIAGSVMIALGLRWYRLSERTRRQFPYCYGDVEISLADYGIPRRSWKKVVFGSDS